MKRKPSVRVPKRREKRLKAVLAGFMLASALLLILVAAGATQDFDGALLRGILDLRSPSGIAVFNGITWLGSVWGTAAVMGIGALLLFKFTEWRTSAAFVALVGSGAGLAEIVKMAVARPRPSIIMDTASEGPGFPSSHTLAAVCSCVGLAWFISRHMPKRERHALLAAGGAVAGAVGFSRLYLGWHYPSDVLEGMLMGLCLIIVFELILTRWHGDVRPLGA